MPFIQVPTDGAGKLVDTVTPASSGHRQIFVLGDPLSTAGLATVTSSAGVRMNLSSGVVTLSSATSLSSGTVTLSSNPTVNVSSGVITLSSNPTVNVSSGVFTLSSNPTVILSSATSLSSGTVTLSSNPTVVLSSPTSLSSGIITFSSAPTINISSGVITLSSAIVISSGLISITSGTITLSSATSLSSGTVTLSSNPTVNVSSGIFTLSSNPTMNISSGVITLSSNPTVNVSSGVISTLSSGPVLISGSTAFGKNAVFKFNSASTFIKISSGPGILWSLLGYSTGSTAVTVNAPVLRLYDATTSVAVIGTSMLMILPMAVVGVFTSASAGSPPATQYSFFPYGVTFSSGLTAEYCITATTTSLTSYTGTGASFTAIIT